MWHFRLAECLENSGRIPESEDGVHVRESDQIHRASPNQPAATQHAHYVEFDKGIYFDSEDIEEKALIGSYYDFSKVAWLGL